MKELLMGNEAIALGALAAGVQVVGGYPGTPSSEVLETIARRNPGNVHVEWSVNEKAGAEVAVGAAISGARAMVTMKQMGLNVASDPVMCVNVLGTRGGLVIYVADDPGPISSQTEQDTRRFGQYTRIPVFDCCSPEQAFRAAQDAFAFSEEYGTPVILRSTTRVCHACADIDVPEITPPQPADGFVKNSKWVIFPGLSYENKKRLVRREPEVADAFSRYPGNTLEGSGPVGIACGGISYAYVKEAVRGFKDRFSLLNIVTPYPFPSTLARRFLRGVEKVMVFEELDPVIEDALIYEQGLAACGTVAVSVLGKRSGTVPAAGELSADIVGRILRKEGDLPARADQADAATPELPVRPPVLCAGCPHRASFYAVKTAAEQARKKEGASFTQAVFHGDIGCYTLGNAAPLNAVDTCLCMGAGITMAQGMNRVDKGTLNFAFAGDSTFFASGITGAVNAVYNQAEIILCILDNSTTAMTGHQPHPGMGITVMGEPVEPVSIEKVLTGIGIPWVRTVNPLDFPAAVKTVGEAIGRKGVRAIVFRSPCVALLRPSDVCRIDGEHCVSCQRCIREIGCPALIPHGKTVRVDESLCTGCGLCAAICPAGRIGKEARK